MITVNLIVLLVITLCCLITGATAGRPSCPRLGNDLSSVTVAIADIEHPPAPLELLGDDSFFTEILKVNQSQIESFAQKAMDFFQTRYGLDFTQSQPDDLGFRHFQNATMIPMTNNPTFGYSVVGNADVLASRIKVPKYYPLRFGGWHVIFNGPQLLTGTYGGPTGIPIGIIPNDIVTWAIYYCATCPNGPLMIQWQTITPLRIEPIDTSAILNLELNHAVLGDGTGRGIVRIEPTDDPNLLHYTIRLVWTFPGNGVTC